MPLTIEDIPANLLESYTSGKSGIFVGAGLSIGAGFPNWGDLLRWLIDRAEADKSLSHRIAEECREHVQDPTKYLMIAEEMKEILAVDFKTYLEEIFTKDTVLPTEVHNLLVTLKNNSFIITTNYDQLIEQAFAKNMVYTTAYKYYEAHAIQRQLYRRKFFLLKAHGDATSAAEHIVLTEKDYRRLLYQEPGYQSALQSIFTMYSVIFIGCSLEDPELKLLLNYINAAFPEGGIPHYALMATEATSETERNRWKKDYNIKIIPVSSENNYEDINTFLKILHESEK